MTENTEKPEDLRDKEEVSTYEMCNLEKLIKEKGEIAIRTFLMATQKENFPDLTQVTLYQVDEGKVLAEYITPGNRKVHAEFLFYESKRPNILGIQIKDTYNHKAWIFQATSGWIHFIYDKVKPAGTDQPV